ncbi:MAG TPA: tetratricopeptide repeat protein [Chryseosolibacter sp.]|nr:tetratricopeptide repeat protein [Chryseosolibacter sp.]
MKRVIFLMLMLSAVAVSAQKKQKPNINKALKSLQEGQLAEAKEMIDAATTYEKTMDDGKTWYYRGLIYAAIDTTSNEAFKSLAEDPFKIAMESFEKADAMGKEGSEYFTTDASSIVPVTKTQQMTQLANHYLNKGAALYQEDKLEEALGLFEKTQVVLPSPEDTIAYFYAGIVANSLEDYDKTIDNLQKYIDNGGTSPDAYSVIINTYSGPKEDKEKALEAARRAKEKFPDNPEFPKVEIGLLIELERIEEAKKGLEEAVVREPDNKTYHFYLGYVNSKLENWEDAKKSFEQALRIDPSYFDAQYYLAQIYLIDAGKVMDQMKNLGLSAADKKKQAELDKVLVEKYKVALPHWEKAEKLKPNDLDVLDRLRTIYYYLGDDANEKRVAAKLKSLNAEE